MFSESDMLQELEGAKQFNFQLESIAQNFGCLRKTRDFLENETYFDIGQKNLPQGQIKSKWTYDCKEFESS